MVYELADGSTVKYTFGLAVIEFMGEITSGRVIFGPDGTEPFAGRDGALESVGIMVASGQSKAEAVAGVAFEVTVAQRPRGAMQRYQRERGNPNV